jgi:hypothetical protein
MYVAMVVLLMLILPIASIVLDAFMHYQGIVHVILVGKWFVFWAEGMRLLIAGLRQIIQPRYTAQTILGIQDADAALIVRELGFANTAIGIAGVGSIFFPAWMLPLAVIGAIFYGLAGISHLTHKSRNSLENVAMTSDLFVSLVLTGFLAWQNVTPQGVE